MPFPENPSPPDRRASRPGPPGRARARRRAGVFARAFLALGLFAAAGAAPAAAQSTLRIGFPSVTEGGPGTTVDLEFTVTVSPPSAGEVTVDYAITGGSARAGEDYGTPTPASPLVIPAGSSMETITVPVTGDDMVEGHEMVTITLSNPVGATIQAGVGTGIILNDDFPELSINSPSVVEGGPGDTPELTFTVSLSQTAPFDVQFSYTSTGGSADPNLDYGTPMPAAPVTIASGATSTTITVPVTGDDTVERDETVEVMLATVATGNATLRPGGETGTGTILNDDFPEILSIDSPSVAEGGPGETPGLVFTVTQSMRAPWDVTVPYAITGGTAMAGTDYGTSGTLTIAASTTVGTLTVPVTGDGTVEPDETVEVTLSSPVATSTTPGGATLVAGGLAATGTILNDDFPELSIDSPSVVEGATGETPVLTFTVSQSMTAPWNVTFGYAVTGVTAQAGIDYGTPAPASPLTIAAGATSTTFTVPVTGDGTVELDETVEVALSAPAVGTSTTPGGARLRAGAATGTGTILNDDFPEVWIDSPSVAEGAAGETPVLAFTVSQSVPVPWDVTVPYAVTDDTAMAGSDYGAATPAGAVMIAMGATSTTLTVPVTGDGMVERDETVKVTLSAPAAGTSTPGGARLRAGGETGTGTILNDDFPEVSIDSPSVVEGAAGETPVLTFTVSQSMTAPWDVAVPYAITGGGAMIGADYGTPAPASPLMIAAGATSTTFTVPVVGDGTVEIDETVEITLSAPVAGTTTPGGALLRAGAATGTGTILNDDFPEVWIDSPSVVEGGPGETPGLVFTVSQSMTAPWDVTVPYAITGGTATSSDYGAATPAGAVTIGAGTTMTTLTVPVTGDGMIETNKTVEITLSAPAAGTTTPGGARLRAGGETGTGTILNDDFPELSIDSPSVVEGAAGETPGLVFTVSQSMATPWDVTFQYAVTGGMAQAGVDYGTPTPVGPLVILAGATSTKITVPVTGDGTVESDETVAITLSAPSAATIRAGAATGTGTIVNDDFPELSIDSPSVAEGDTGDTPGLVFTVSQSMVAPWDVKFEYAVASGTAQAGLDYGAPAPATPLTIMAGATSTKLTVPITGDGTVERDETVAITLSAPSRATILAGGATGTGTIVNDDFPELSINSPSIAEGAPGDTPGLVFTVSQSKPAPWDVTFGYAVASGTAQAGVDHGTPAPASPLTIAAGATTTTLTVPVTGDDMVERDETVEITLSAPTVGASTTPGGARLQAGGETGTGTIRNDDFPEIWIDSPSAAEDGSELVFTVSQSVAAPWDVTVGYVLTGVTAQAGDDYGAATPAGTLTVPAGATTTTLTVPVTADGMVELDETVRVTLLTPTNATIRTGGGMGTGTILNDDFPELSIDSPSVLEGATGETPVLTFTVSQSAVSPWDVTFGYAVASGTAQVGVDYGTPSPSSPLMIAAGATSTTITVPVTGDDMIEFDETVQVTLSAPVGGTTTPGGATLRTGGETGTGTILNDDFPELSIDSPSVVEGGPGEMPALTFTVSQSATAPWDIAFGYTVTGGAAQAGIDYGAATPASPLTIAAGATTTTFTVPVTGEDMVERDEKVEITLSAPTAGTTTPGGARLRAGGETGAGTILNDDFPEVSINSPSVAEGAAGETPGLVFTVSQSMTAPWDVTVPYAITGGTATSSDYGAATPAGTVTIAAGTTTATLMVPVTGDGTVELDERVEITLSPPTAGTSTTPGGARLLAGGETGTGTILNDDFPELSIDSPSVVEGAAGETPVLTFTVSQSMPAPWDVTFPYVTSGGAAMAGVDYGAATPASPLTIAAGATSTTFTVPVTGDGEVELDERVEITLSPPAAGTSTTPGGARLRAGGETGAGTILNDDFPELSIDSPSVVEGAAGETPVLTFTVSQSMTAPWDVTVPYAITGGTAASGTDYGSATPAGTLTIAAGTTTATLTVPVAGDGAAELDETVEVTLSPPAAGTSTTPGGARLRAGGETGTGTILNDDFPEVSIDSPSVVEGAAGETPGLVFTVSQSMPAPWDVTVPYAITGGMAQAGSDYGTSTPATPLTIAAGATTTTFTVPVTGDDAVEFDETVEVTLSAPSGGTSTPGGARLRAGGETGTGTILNDDFSELSIDSPSVVEGAVGEMPVLTFTVSQSMTVPWDVTVPYAITGGTAASGTDYGAATPASTLTIAAGTTTTTLTVPVMGDGTVELDETVVVTLSPPAAGTTTPGGARLRAGGETGAGTILNDDFPEVSIDSPSTVEGAAGETPVLTFTVSQSMPAPWDVTVPYAITGGTAMSGDYGAATPSSTITIRAGTTTATLTVPVTGDDEVESDETVEVTLSPPAAGTSTTPGGARLRAGGETGTGTILNDDFPELSIDSPSTVEGASGTTPGLVFTVSQSMPAPWDVTVPYAITGGTATSSDYGAATPAGAVTVAAGATTTTLTVPVTGDDKVELDETVVVTLSPPTAGTTTPGGATLRAGGETGTGTIRNDDFPELFIDSPSVAEGAAGETPGLVFTVSQSMPAPWDVTFGYVVTGGTAQVGRDYGVATPASPLTIAAGATTTTLTVPVTGDGTAEPDETVEITLLAPAAGTRTPGGARLRAGGETGTGTILNDDFPEIWIDSPSVAEGAAGETPGLTFTVSQSMPAPWDVTVPYTVTGGTAMSGSDYGGATSASPLVIAAGATTTTFTVQVTGDDTVELDEEVEITLLNPPAGTSTTPGGARLRAGGETGTGTIVNDDFPELSIDSPSVAEGAAGETPVLTFTVSQSMTAPWDVTFGYVVTDGTAQAGSDYGTATPAGPLTITAGATSTTITVPVMGDGTVEIDETVEVTLSAPAAGTTTPGGARLRAGGETGAGTILNDDFPEVSIDSPSVVEGAAGETPALTFTVSQSMPAPWDVAVPYAITGGTAMAGVDYGAATPASALTIAAGTTTATLTVPVTGDGTVENDETVEITLSPPAVGTSTTPGGARLRAGAATGTGTIVNDDFPEIWIDSPSVAEGAAGETPGLVFTVSQSMPAPWDITVQYAISGGTATTTVDYGTATPAGPLTIAAGATTTTITVPVTGDGAVEFDETVEVTLSAPSGGARLRAGGETGTGTILNDDFPELSIDSPSVLEGGPGETPGLTFTVSQSKAAPWDVTFGYVLTGGTGQIGIDYGVATPTSPLTIAAGATSTTFTVPVTGDGTAELDETVEMRLLPPAAGAMTPGGARLRAGGETGTGTIRNDDFPEVWIDSPSVAEGASGETPGLVFTVSQSTAVPWDVMVPYTVTGGTAVSGSDYGGATSASPLTIAAGATTTTFTVQVTGDDTVERDEEVEITLLNPLAGTTTPGGARLRAGGETGTGTILNDDFPELFIDSPSVAEGAAGETPGLVFTVSQSMTAPWDVTFGYVVTDGTAMSGSDYATSTPPTPLTIAAGGTSTTLTVSVTGDGTVELDETVEVTLLAPAAGTTTPGGARLRAGGETGTGTIVNDDFPELSIDSPSVVEGGPGDTPALVFTVTQSVTSPARITVQYTVTDGTAEAGTDYGTATPAGPLVIAPGATTTTLTVPVTGDDMVEIDEMLTVTLSGPVDATLRAGGETGTGTILNDDFPELSIDSPSVAEGAAGDRRGLVFTVSQSMPAPWDVTFAYATTAGTAAATADYGTPAPLSPLTIMAGATTTTITVPVVGDDTVEEDETVTVVLSPPLAGTTTPGGATLRAGGETGTGTILNDDFPELSIDFASVVEGAPGETPVLRFTVSQSMVAPWDVAFGYAVTDGTAQAGADYGTATPAGPLVIAAGTTTTTLTVPVIGEGTVEIDETVLVTLLSPTVGTTTPGGATLRAGGETGTGTILNDDFPELFIDSPSVAEGAAGETPDLVFTVSQSMRAPWDVTVPYAITGGTAVSGTDYGAATPGIALTILAGATTTTLTVPVTGNDTVELDKTVEVTLSAPSAGTTTPGGATLLAGGATGTGTIVNDDFPELSIDSPSVTEGAAGETPGLVFTVSQSMVAPWDVTVGYAVTGGTARAGVDYGTATPASPLTIAAGATSTTITVPVTGEGVFELDETVEITLSNPTDAALRAGGETGTGTIVNDDFPEFSIDSPSAAEGAPLQTSILVFTVSLSATSPGDATVGYAITGGTATGGTDYGTPLPPAPLTIAAGATSTTLTVPVLGDDEIELDETVEITLSGPVGATLGTVGASGTGTIVNDDFPELSIDSPSVVEGAAGETPGLVFTLSLSEPPLWDVTVGYAVTGGTAMAGIDYGTATPASPLTIAAGTTTTTLTVPVTGEDVIELDETVEVTLSGPVGARLRAGGETGTGTIVNDDLPEISIDSPSVAEGAPLQTSGLVFTVSLSRPSPREARVTYTVTGGTATAGDDYGTPLPPAPLTILPGATATTITVPVMGDDVFERDETVVIALSAPVEATLRAGGATGTGTILNDDVPRISIDSPSVVEGAPLQTAALVFTVSLSATTTRDVTVAYAVTGGSAVSGTDYGPPVPASPLIIPAGSTTTTITVPVTGDDTLEPDETVEITLSGAIAAMIETGLGRGTIRNDDFPEVLVDSPSVVEGAPFQTSRLVFTVSLSATSPGDVTVGYAVTGGTARLGDDYGPPLPAGPLMIAAGATSTALTVPVLGDDMIEDDETVEITLSGPTGATLRAGRETGTGAIVNDDFPGISIDSPSVAEGAPGETPSLVFTVSLSATSHEAVTVGYAVTGGTAQAGIDYGAATPAGPLTIATGTPATTITVPVMGDNVFEDDETVEITLSNPVGASIGTAVGVGTILNDELPELSIDSPSVAEGAPGETPLLTFTVSMSATSASDVTVRYSVSGGTAGFGIDYGAPSPPNPLRIPVGSTTTTLTIPVTGDAAIESNETVEIRISNPSGATIRAGGGAGTGTIRNDDLPTLSVDSPAVGEGDAGSTTTLVFTVTLSVAAPEDVTVAYRVSGGTALAGVDFRDVSGTLVILRAQRTGTIRVPVLGDDVGEAQETVVIELSGPVGAAFAGGGSTLEAEGIIRNDDPALSIGPAETSEGMAGATTTLTFTVTLVPPAALPVTVDWSVTGGTATAGIDFRDGSGTLTFAAGETVKTIALTVIGDDAVEGDETVAVGLANPSNATIVEATGTGTIRENLRTLSINSPSVDEGDVGTATLTFRVTLDGPAPVQDVTVDWRVVAASGTATSAPATAGTDYQPLTGGTLRFVAPSENVKTIAVTVLGDTGAELDETVTIQLTNVTGASIRTARGTGTIRNDDQPSVSIGSPEVREGASGSTTTMTFEVTLSGPVSEDVTVRYSLGGTAEAGADFTDPGGGTLVIPAGATRAVIMLAVQGDAQGEPTETVMVQLTAPDGTAVTGTGTIRNDDPALAIRAGEVEEGATGETRLLPFRVTVDPPTSGQVTVGYEVLADGTAEPGADHQALLPGRLTIPAGTGSTTIAVLVIGDDEPEDDETVVLRLASPSGADILAGAGTAEGTIRDDDGNLDAQAKALSYVLSGVGRTLAANFVDAIWSRAEDHRGVGDAYATVGGRSLDTGVFVADDGGTERGAALRAAVGLAGDLLGVETDSSTALLRDAERRLATGRGLDAFRDWAGLPDRRALAGRTRFAIPFDTDTADNRGNGTVTLWGRGSLTSYESEIEGGDGFSAFTSEGEVTTGHLGLDFRSGRGFLVGIALGSTSGEADYRFADEADGRGVVKTELTSAHPYLHWMSPDGVGMWFAAGYGTGSAEINKEGGGSDDAIKTDITMEMAAAGVQGDLPNVDGLAVKFDAFGVKIKTDGTEETEEGGGLAEVEGEASRARLAFQAAGERVLAGGGVLAGSFELGARLDGGTAEKGAGADVAVGFGYAVPHLDFELRGRGGMLVAHQQDGYREWNLGLELAVGGSGDGRRRGLQFLFEPVWRSRTQVRNADLWNTAPGALSQTESGSAGAAFKARLGYGMGVLDDRMLMTVFGELGRSGDDDRLRLGAELRQPGDGGLGLELYGERRDLSGGRRDRALFLKGSLDF